MLVFSSPSSRAVLVVAVCVERRGVLPHGGRQLCGTALARRPAQIEARSEVVFTPRAIMINSCEERRASGAEDGSQFLGRPAHVGAG